MVPLVAGAGPCAASCLKAHALACVCPGMCPARPPIQASFTTSCLDIAMPHPCKNNSKPTNAYIYEMPSYYISHRKNKNPSRPPIQASFSTSAWTSPYHAHAKIKGQKSWLAFWLSFLLLFFVFFPFFFRFCVGLRQLHTEGSMLFSRNITKDIKKAQKSQINSRPLRGALIIYNLEFKIRY